MSTLAQLLADRVRLVAARSDHKAAIRRLRSGIRMHGRHLSDLTAQLEALDARLLREHSVLASPTGAEGEDLHGRGHASSRDSVARLAR